MKKWVKTIGFMAVGIAFGLAYYALIGCNTGG